MKNFSLLSAHNRGGFGGGGGVDFGRSEVLRSRVPILQKIKWARIKLFQKSNFSKFQKRNFLAKLQSFFNSS